MQALLALYDMSRRRVAEELAQRMVSALQHRPRERQGQWRTESGWIGVLAWPTTEREAREQQPLSHHGAGGELCVALDGRIDNRDELRRVLGGDGRDPNGGDAALVLQAYRRWGTDALPRLMGDYALVLFDGPRERMVLARDPSGIRPLYYALHDHTLLAASELSCLRAAGVGDAVDESSVAERLFNTVLGHGRTLFRDIKRLPPGHVLVAASGFMPRLSRFHSWDGAKPIRLPSDQAYAEGFREVLSEAVRCRLHSHHPVALELSGGLDSSSICVLADELPAGRQSAAYSLVFPGLPCDESDFIQAVVAQCSLPHHASEPAHLDMALAAAQARRDQDVPAYPNGVMSRPLRLAARGRGCRVTLTGSGSDEWWTGSRFDGAELLRRGQLGRAARWLWQQSMRGADWGAALRLGVGPLLPWTLRQLRQRLRRHPSPWPWIRAGLLSRTEIVERLHTPPRWQLRHDLAQQDIVAVVEQGWVFHAYEMEAREAASYGIEIRQPFTDRRLCDWALGVPMEQRARAGVSKYVLRQALRGGGAVGGAAAGLPERVRTRSSKAEFSHLYLYALQAARQALAGQVLHIHQRGWVDQAELWRALTAIEGRARHEPGGLVTADEDSAAAQALWNAVALELWLRAAHPSESHDRQAY